METLSKNLKVDNSIKLPFTGTLKHLIESIISEANATNELAGQKYRNPIKY